MNRLGSVSLGVLLLAAAGCHGEVDQTPLIDRKIYLTDKFYDVQAVSADKVIIAGYGGKILTSDDGGRSWNVGTSGTENAIYKTRMVDASNGWAVGQGGTVLKTTDGGKTWQKVETGNDTSLFSLFVVSPQKVIAVGEKATLISTDDGGATWKTTKVQAKAKEAGSDEAMIGLNDASVVAQDPALYDIKFVDDKNGWVVGEFGKILHTSDGGATWKEQQQSLVGGAVADALDLPTFYGVDCTSTKDCTAVGLDGKIASTKDGGGSWAFEQVAGDFSEPLLTVQVFPDGSGWAAGIAGEVLKRDRGEWAPADLGMRVPSWIRQLGFADASNGWLVGGFGTILHTRDGGKTWIPAAA